jgi:4-hydroxy 2-oxovalerate aldolase
MSKWKDNDDFLSKLHLLSSVVDVFCMVDSYGGVFPEEVKNTICLLISKTTCKIGFHGHNNLEMGLVNTIAAIEHGAEYVDATVLGMGRGAGNLKTELLLTYLNKNHNLEVDFNKLGDIITAFSGLLKKYSWGTNLPYMISGANSFPQKEVMDWISNRLYSFDNVVRALNNKKGNIVDNAKYPLFESVKFDKVIIIGGGSNAVFHIDGIKAFIKQQKSIALVHATVRYADEFKDVEVPQFFCAATSEGKRLTKVFNKKSFKGKYILPPYPRKMGTDVPELANNSTFELPSIDFTKSYWDSCTTIALQTALFLCDNDIYTIGYDGYPGNVLSEKEMALSNENKTLFLDFKKFRGKTLVSLTPTLYNELFSISLYQYI